MTNLAMFQKPAAYMVHDIGPRRFWLSTAMRKDDWTKTTLGQALLALLQEHGLDQRDACLAESPKRSVLQTDAGAVWITDPTLAKHRSELADKFSAIAFGVAQERMMRLSGWNAEQELPLWAITASEAMVEMLKAHGATPSELWNAGVNIADDGSIDRPSFVTREDAYRACDPRAAFPAGCYVARFGTGMRLSLAEGDIDYHESEDGASLTIPLSLLRLKDATRLVGMSVGEICLLQGKLLNALAGYRIVEATPIVNSKAVILEVLRIRLRLAVGIRTLQPIPNAVLYLSGVKPSDPSEQDRPLWMLTRPHLLKL